MKKKLLAGAITLLSVATLAACSKGSEGADLISMKGDVITEHQFYEQVKINPSAQQVLLNLTIQKVFEKQYGSEVDDKEVNDTIAEEEKQYGGKDQFESMLKQQGMTLDDYKEQKRLSAYQKQLLNDKVKVSDKEIKDDTKKASHILIKVKSDSDKEGLSDKKAKQKAEEIQKEVSKDPSKFGEIAKKESMDSSSAKKDGSLGYVIKGQMVDSFEKALFKLKEGEVSKVVKTDYGYHIIKADKETDFNSEKSNIKQKLIEEKVQKKPKLLTDAYKELLKEYKVDYKDRDIKKAIEDSILDPDKIKQQQQQQSQGGSGLTNSGS